jgi:hypothetical protein
LDGAVADSSQTSSYRNIYPISLFKTNQFYGAEHQSTGPLQLLGHSILSQHFDVQYRIHESSPPVHLLSQTNYPPTYVLVFLAVSFPLAFPPTTYTRSSSPIRAKFPAHLILLALIILIILGEEYKSRSSSSCSFLHSPVTSSLSLRSKYPPQHPILSPCSSIDVRRQVSHPYRTTGKIIVSRRQKLLDRMVTSITRLLLSSIHKLVTSVWNKEDLPDQRKESITVQIHKKRNKTDSNNYRGISIHTKLCRISSSQG